MRIFRSSLLSRAGLAAVLAVIVSVAPAPGVAQSLFAPVRQVNDRIITSFDLEQRIGFMSLLSAGASDMRAEALLRLTNEAVQRDYARRLNLRVDRDELAEGMAEFASRADLDTDEFVALLEQGGVARESFEAFVEAGLLWRKVVAQQFPPLISVPDTELERVRDVASILGRTRVLLSEIFLPTDPQFAEPVAQIMELIEAANGSVEEFSRLAREFSLAGTRDEGGRLPDWVPVENLPGVISDPLASIGPGQIIGPLQLNPEAIAYFQLRARESTRDIPPGQVQLSYKRLMLPDASSAATVARAAEIQAQVRSCPELGPFARGLSDDALVEREALVNEIPQIEAVELARLDRNQISTALTVGGQRMVLMLCSRQLQSEEAPGDNQLRNIVFERRLNEMAEMRLQELVADADIRDF